MFTQFLVRNDFLKFLILNLERVSLSAEHESELAESHFVLASVHYFLNHAHIVYLLGYSQGLRVFLLSHVDGESCFESTHHFFGVCCVLSTT